MLAASKEGEHFSQLKYKRFLHKVEQQRYTPKEPKDSRKLHFDTRQCIGHIGTSSRALWGAWTKTYNPWVINRNMILIKKMGNGLTAVFPAVLGEDHPLTGSTVPSSQTANSTALLFPTHSNLTTEPCTVFILRSQYLNDHELTRLACVFQNAILPSKHNTDWKDRPNFYKLRGNSEIST